MAKNRTIGIVFFLIVILAAAGGYYYQQRKASVSMANAVVVTDILKARFPAAKYTLNKASTGETVLENLGFDVVHGGKNYFFSVDALRFMDNGKVLATRALVKTEDKPGEDLKAGFKQVIIHDLDLSTAFPERFDIEAQGVVVEGKTAMSMYNNIQGFQMLLAAQPEEVRALPEKLLNSGEALQVRIRGNLSPATRQFTLLHEYVLPELLRLEQDIQVVNAEKEHFVKALSLFNEYISASPLSREQEMEFKQRMQGIFTTEQLQSAKITLENQGLVQDGLRIYAALRRITADQALADALVALEKVKSGAVDPQMSGEMKEAQESVLTQLKQAVHTLLKGEKKSVVVSMNLKPELLGKPVTQTIGNPLERFIITIAND